MTLASFLKEMSKKKIQLWVEDEELNYRAPQNVITPKVIEEILKYKQNILEIQEEGDKKIEIAPLSYGQDALWFLQQVNPENSAYNCGSALYLRFNVNIILLMQTCQEILDHHPLLRATFPIKEGEPIQLINKDCDVSFETIDASDWTTSKLYSRVVTAFNEPFNLMKGPIIRFHLFSGQEQNHVFLITAHHIVSDGWSLSILLKSLLEIYVSKITKKESNFTPTTHQYIDYIQWQTEMLDNLEGETHLQYWKNRLSGKLPILKLKTDKPRPLMQTQNGDSYKFSINEELTEKIKYLSKEMETTLFTVLLGVYYIFLYRHTKQEDILIGSPCTGRSKSKFDEIIGYFSNAIVLRADLSGNPSFKNFVKQLRVSVLRDLTHQDYPLSLLVNKLQLKHDASRSALFQVMFNFMQVHQHKESMENFVKEDLPFAATEHGPVIETYDIPKQEGQFDLSLEIIDLSTTLRCSFKYNTDLYHKTSIENFAEEYSDLIETIVKNPNQVLLDLCENPISEIDERKLLEDKKALLKLLLEEEDYSILNEDVKLSQKTESIIPANRTNNIPLSFSQERLWFLYHLDSENAVFNMPFAFRLHGSIQPGILEKVLSEIIRRHEILRTNFVMDRGAPKQVIQEEFELLLPIIDLGLLSNEQKSSELRRLIAHETMQPFYLEKNPLIRFAIIKLDNEEQVLVLTLHHIISDGWSIPILYHEAFTLFDAYVQGLPSPLKKLPIQYADYAIWQRQWMNNKRQEKHLKYWTKKLSGVTRGLKLFTDYSYTSQKGRGQRQFFQISNEDWKEIKKLGNKEDCSSFITLLSIFKTLLFLYTGQEHVLLTTPIANRNRAEFEKLIGIFVNILILSTDFSRNPTFRELLRRVRKTCLDAYAHQDYPFEKIIEHLNLPQNFKDPSKVSVSFTLVNAMPDNDSEEDYIEDSGTTIIPMSREIEISKTDLSIILFENEESLYGRLHYNSDLFKPTTIAQIIEDFRQLVGLIAKNPDQYLSEIFILNDTTKKKILIDYNRTDALWPKRNTVCQSFESQVEKTPDRIAVVMGSRSITNGELNRKSNQISHYFTSMGVGPEVKVGICIDRSIEMVIGLLGILKAGGAFVPLDPKYPKERLAFMIEDSQIQIILTMEEFKKNLPSTNTRVILLDSDWEQFETMSTVNKINGTIDQNLAYIIYTSGSTGRPKGTLIQQNSLMNFVNSAIMDYEITLHDRVLQFSSISFDTAMEEIFPCLNSGGSLVLRKNESLGATSDFLQECEEMNITMLDLPTAYWHILVSDMVTKNLEMPKSIRLLIIGGEKANLKQVREWENYMGSCPKLLNTYGPTETTVVSTLTELTGSCSPEFNDREVSIGKPISNCQVFILNKFMQPVSIGIPGEMYIGGKGMARSYHRAPEINALKFVPNPFSNEGGARLYKTGDLVRYLSDGNIQYLDRIDYQVKIRGFRIELGEIEASLKEHPDIKDAIVIEDKENEENRLITYITCKIDNLLTDSLRGFLQKKLPGYMIPNSYIMLDQFPLTINGKIDRNNLPKSNKLDDLQNNNYTPPRDVLEFQLTEIWEELLDSHPIGLTDDFFNIGGHSFLAIRLIAKIEEQFGMKLPLADMFPNANIQHLAKIIRKNTNVLNQTSLIPMQPKGNLLPFFCIHPVGGNVFCYYKLSSYFRPERPFYGIQSQGLYGKEKTLISIEDMASSYIKLIKSVQLHGPYAIGGWSLGGAIAFEMAHQLDNLGNKVDHLFLIECFNPLIMKFPKEVGETELLLSFINDLGRLAGKKVSISPNDLSSYDEEEQLNYIINQGKSLNAIPSEMKVEQVVRLLRVYHHNSKAMSNYKPKRYYGDITLLYGDENKIAGKNPTLGWEAFAENKIEIYKIPGNHYSILTEPNILNLYKILNSSLDDSQ